MHHLSLSFEWGKDAEALALLERLRWPDGVRCPWCESDRVTRFTVKESVRRTRKSAAGAARAIPLRRLYDCLNPGCRHQFSVTSGTLLHNSKVPVWKWLAAIGLQLECNGRFGARELQAELGLTYKTAWAMCHRIREAMVSCDLLEEGFDARRKPAAGTDFSVPRPALRFKASAA